MPLAVRYSFVITSYSIHYTKLYEPLGIRVNVVSVPCFDLFNEQDATYKAQVIDPNTKVLAVEAATATEYYRYADDVLGMESFGASAPAELLFEKFGFTKENIMKRSCKLMNVEYKEVDMGECESYNFV